MVYTIKFDCNVITYNGDNDDIAQVMTDIEGLAEKLVEDKYYEEPSNYEDGCVESGVVLDENNNVVGKVEVEFSLNPCFVGRGRWGKK